jgi:raffinose/stachyose/melibiose transport system substrate-binding protein
MAGSKTFKPTRRVLMGAALLGAASASLPPANAQMPPPPYAPPKPGDSKKLTLRFATSYAGVHPMGPVVKKVLETFTDQYPNVTIKIEGTPGNDHQTKIKLDASADRMPDVFNYWRLDPGFGLDQIARAGKLADLTAWTKADPFFNGLFDDYSWKTASLDGKVYGIPLLMFYVEFLANKAVFARAGVPLPTDWDSLLSSVKALKQKGELPWAISIGNDSEGGRIYNYVVNRSLGNERALRMHSGQEPINVPEMVAAMQNLRELVVGNIPADAISIQNDSVYAKYVNTNRGALILDGSWVTPTIKPAVQENLVVLDFPLIPGGAQKQRNVERDLTSLWYVSAKSMRDDEKRPYVLQLIRHLASRQSAKIYAEQANQQVAALGVDYDESKYGRVAREAQTMAVNAPGNKWIPSVMTPVQRAKFEPALGEFLSGQHDPNAFVALLGTIFAA